MKKIIICTIILQINLTITPMMTGIRKMPAFNRVGYSAMQTMVPGIFDNTIIPDQISNNPTQIPALPPAEQLNPSPSFNFDQTPIFSQIPIKTTPHKKAPVIKYDAKTTSLTPSSPFKSTEFQVRVTTKGVANAIYGNPVSKPLTTMQKRNYSTSEFKNMLQIDYDSVENLTKISNKVKSAIMPTRMSYNLKALPDGTYKPKWKELIQDNHIAIVASFLQAKLDIDKYDLMTQAIQYCNPNDMNVILRFYKNNDDIKVINDAFYKLLRDAEGTNSPINISVDIIQQLKEAGLSQDIITRAALHFIEFGDYTLMKAINPQWFIEKLEYQKSLLSVASDISEQQKQMLKNIFETLTLDLNLSSLGYQLTDQQIEQIIQSGLKFSQIKKYIPNDLFDTKRIFDMMNTTITAQALLQADPYILRQSKINFVLENDFIDKIIAIEQEMQPEGYFTFVTGRNWNFNFAQDMWNLVKSVKARSPYMQKIIELAPDKYQNYTQNDSTIIQEALQQRKKILENGRPQCTSNGICLNSTLFENFDNCYINTSFYIGKNFSMDFKGHSPLHIFQQYDMSDIYKKYEKEIHQLKDLHEQSSYFGELLAVSIHKEKIDSLTYVATYYGVKYLTCKPSEMLEKAYTDTKRTKYSSLKSRPQNYFYYLVTPGIPGESEKDYKVRSIIKITDPEKFEQYKQRLDQLFENIKHDSLEFYPQEGSQFALFEEYCTDYFNFHQNLEYEID